MNPLIVQLFTVFAPMALELYAKIQAQHAAAGTPMPTGPALTALLVAEFQGNIAKYLAEGAAWTAAHPTPKEA